MCTRVLRVAGVLPVIQQGSDISLDMWEMLRAHARADSCRNRAHGEDKGTRPGSETWPSDRSVDGLIKNPRV
jgi:hypothetical protein